MKIILHIGTHKTGTTTIQNHCDNNKTALLQNGVFWPSTNRLGKLPQHSGIATLIREQRDSELKRFFDETIDFAEKERCQTILFSGEELCHLNSAHIKQLKQYTNDHGAQIICYFRNVYDYVISALSEGLKKQAQFLESQNPIRHVMENLNYSSILRRWEEVFGEENTHAFSYDQHKQGIVEHFCKSIGVDRKVLLADRAKSADRNISPDFTSLIFWSFADLIRTPDEYRQISKQYKSIFKNSQMHRSVFTIEFAHFIVKNLSCTYDHKKLQPIRDFITRKPKPRFSKDQYLEKIEEFIRALRGSQLTFWQKLRLLFR